MAISRKLGAVLGGAALVLSAACTQDLSVPNNNNPDVERALANPGDVKALAISSIENWFTTAGYYDPWTMLNVTGDLETANFGNFGMRFNNVEPRIPYANDAANGDVEAARDPWNFEYQALGAANDVLRAVKGGIVFPDESGTPSQDVTDQYKALALWAQAGALMQIALIFDKGFIVDEDFDASTQTPSLAPYTDVAAAAQSKLDALIALTAGKDWTYQDSDFPLYGQTLTANSLNRIANTMAAQLLAYTPRDKNATENNVDWNKVLQYANGGIGTGPAGDPFDWAIQGDGGSQWYVYLTLYFDFPSWMAVDQKLIHKMASCVPEKFDGTLVPPDTTCAGNPTGAHDARVATDFSGDAHTSGADFVYVGAPIGSRSRGVYMQSPYFHERYMDQSFEADICCTGRMPYVLAAESDLIRAEALIRTGGDRQTAADLINNTRVGRGHLAPILATASNDEFYTDILYEREVETDATDGFGFFALRHEDELQDGTLRHLPVPATELENLSLPIYTFGGVGLPVESVTPVGAVHKLLKSMNSRPTMDLALPNGSVMKLQVPQTAGPARLPGTRH